VGRLNNTKDFKIVSPHPEAQGFERGMVRDPDDRTAQLVYSDWLEERISDGLVGVETYILTLRSDKMDLVIGMALESKTSPFAIWLDIEMAPLGRWIHTLVKSGSVKRWA